MSKFWKATRPDGTDFYTGEVDYAAALASGQPLPELWGGVFPGDGWYHVGVHPTSCVGMQWPCRLFLVEPVGPVEHAGKEKAGCRSLRVVEERPAHEALGPQGEHVTALIDKAAHLTTEQVRRLRVAMDAARYAAWDAAGDAAWDAARDAARDAAWGAAWDAARDAAWALVIRDLIGTGNWTQDNYDALTGPWRRAIGPIHPDDPTLDGGAE